MYDVRICISAYICAGFLEILYYSLAKRKLMTKVFWPKVLIFLVFAILKKIESVSLHHIYSIFISRENTLYDNRVTKTTNRKIANNEVWNVFISSHVPLCMFELLSRQAIRFLFYFMIYSTSIFANTCRLLNS